MRSVALVAVLVSACAPIPGGTPPHRGDPDYDYADGADPGPCVPECGPSSCGDDGCGGSCGGCGFGDACGAALECAPIAGPAPLAVFVFDTSLDAILRMVDLDGDGSVLDPGETTVFFDGTVETTADVQGLFALGAHTVLAADASAPANVVRLEDRNRDGDALDEGESAIWFSGVLPGGYRLVSPAELGRGPDDAVYLLENNNLSAENPEAVYRLEDLNGDGDAEDADECTLFARIADVGASATSTRSIRFDAEGVGYVLDTGTGGTELGNVSLDRLPLDGSPMEEWLTSEGLELATAGMSTSSAGAIRLSAIQAEIELDFRTNELLVPATDDDGNHYLLAIDDPQRDGTSETARVRVLYATIDGGAMRDLFLTEDHTVVFTDALRDRVVRLVDANGDGDFLDAGEERVIYRAADAEEVGLPSARASQAIAAALVR